MKFSVACLALMAVPSAAFVVQPPSQQQSTQLFAKAKPAKSKEEDLDLTRQVIAGFVEIEGGEEPEAEKPKPKKKKAEAKEE